MSTGSAVSYFREKLHLDVSLGFEYASDESVIFFMVLALQFTLKVISLC